MYSIWEKYRKHIARIILTIVVFLLIYFLITVIVPFFTPFVIAVVLAFVNEPVIELLEKRVKMPRKLAALISLLFTLGILGTLLALGILNIYRELSNLQERLSIYVGSFSEKITYYSQQISDYYSHLPVGVSDTLTGSLKSFLPKIQSFVSSIASHLIDTITSIPKVTVFIIVTFLSTYFISNDRKEIRGFIYKQLPEQWTKKIPEIKKRSFSAIFGYIKSTLILVILTFAEVSLGLLVIRSDYVLLMSIIVAISEIIPIVGTGLIMVPWIIWNLIAGNVQMALGLTAVYLLGIILRLIIEPKIPGNRISVHPLATLVSMYLGFYLFGILGMFIGPISVIIVKNLQDSGLLKVWKN